MLGTIPKLKIYISFKQTQSFKYYIQKRKLYGMKDV